MAKQAHIVSFEDARARLFRGGASVAQRRDTQSAARDARGMRDANGNASQRRDSGWHQSRSRYSSSLALAGGKRSAVVEEETAERINSRPSRRSQETTRSEEAPARRQKAFAFDGGVSSNREEASGKRDRRRSRTKAKASRMFEKQFSEDVTQATAVEQDAPRAALYEGKMGSTHRKTARMQRTSTASPVSSKLDPSGWQLPSFVTVRRLKIATAALCLILVGLFLYAPAQQFYQAQREHDRLAAEYSIIDQRNDTLDVQNDILASEAGLEDAVREKYGYVRTGEQVAVVTGLSANTTDTSRDGENIEANVLSSAVRSPEEWYTPLLDAFFNVQ